MNDLETMWNNMGTTSFVVINTHASPEKLGNEKGSSNDTDKLTIVEINNLNYKKVDTLVLLGCNAGHYEYVTTNVAYAFCKRTSEYGHIFLDELGKTLTIYNLIECVRINNNFKSYK